MPRLSLHQKLQPNHTALIVIDIQNDFCSPTGKQARQGKDVTGMDKLVSDILQLITACKAVDIPIFYTQQRYDRSKLTPLQKEQYDLDDKYITCDIASDGYKFYQLRPPKNRVFPKYNYNVFSNVALSQELINRDIKTLIITGVVTQVCVETAVRNGFDIGYKIVVPRELVASTSQDPETHPRSLKLIKKTYAVVPHLSEVLAILTSYTKT